MFIFYLLIHVAIKNGNSSKTQVEFNQVCVVIYFGGLFSKYIFKPCQLCWVGFYCDADVCVCVCVCVCDSVNKISQKVFQLI